MSSPKDSAILPQEVVDAFTSAVLTTLQELVQAEGAIDGGDHLSTEASLAEPIVSATIHLVRQGPGMMTLVLPVESAMLLAARYLPAGTRLTDEIVDDVVGEFANVIAGQAKTMLKGSPFHFAMSPPLVIRVASPGGLFKNPAITPVVSLTADWGRLLVLLHLPPLPGA